jgi:hypothetical protein
MESVAVATAFGERTAAARPPALAQASACHVELMRTSGGVAARTAAAA